MDDNLIEGFINDGWQALDLTTTNIDAVLRSLTRRVGQLSMSELQVKGSEQARTNTLSNLHGAGGFPHHTDFAFRPIPARAVMLVNPNGQEFARPSYFTVFDELEEKHLGALGRSEWELRVREGMFVVGGAFSLGGRVGLRWDTDFLKPRNGAAMRCAKDLPSELVSRQRTHVWQGHTALLLDNWRCTHARGGNSGADDDTGKRTLVRYEVWQHAGLDE